MSLLVHVSLHAFSHVVFLLDSLALQESLVYKIALSQFMNAQIVRVQCC